MVYNIPKEKDSNLVARTKDSISWETPVGWHEDAGVGLRRASFTSEEPSVDISLVTFPLSGGGLLPNLNRWREQVNLPSLVYTPELEKLNSNNLQFYIVKLESPDGKKSLMGAFLFLKQQSWFFKMTGSPRAILKEQPRFLQFIRSIVFFREENFKSTDSRPELN